MVSIKSAGLVAAAMVIAPAFADQAMPDNGGGRYTFQKTADGIVRLDSQTGQVALCSPHTVGWACLAAPDDRAALEDEIARLRSENAALKQDLLSRGLPLPAGTLPQVAGDHHNDITIGLPDDAQINGAIAYMGDVWHRFVAAIARAQKHVLNRT
jgi:hypothetical protein